MKKDYQIFVENGKFGLKDPKGFSVLYAVYDEIDFTDATSPIRVKKNGKWGLMDSKGHVLIEPQYGCIDTLGFGRIAVELDDKWGFFDYSGKLVIPMLYDFIWEFSDPADSFGVSMAFVSKDGKYGAINDVGDVVIPFEYDDIFDCRKGYIIVEKAKSLAVINYKNEIIVPFSDKMLDFCDDDLVLWSDDNRSEVTNLITKEKQMVNYGISDEFIGDYLIVYKEDKHNIVDRSFRLVLPEWYDNIVALHDFGYLLNNDTRYYLLKHLGDRKAMTVECKTDVNGVYSSDGKTLLLPFYHNNVLDVSGGVKNFALHATATCGGRCQLEESTKIIKFSEGVTKIGTGWEDFDVKIFADSITIYLPSTLIHVDANAFIKLAHMIKHIYVPAGKGDAIRAVLPPHLSAFVKELKPGFSGFVKKMKSYKDVFSVKKNVFINKNSKLYDLIVSMSSLLSLLIPYTGFVWMSDTILPFDHFQMYTFFFILAVGVYSGLKTLIKAIKLKKYGFRELFWCFAMKFFVWGLGTAVVIGLIFLLVFGVNRFVGSEGREYIDGKVVEIGKYNKGGHYAIIDIPKFNMEYKRNISGNVPMNGSSCVVKCHKGALGLYYIDDVQ